MLEEKINWQLRFCTWSYRSDFHLDIDRISDRRLTNGMGVLCRRKKAGKGTGSCKIAAAPRPCFPGFSVNFTDIQCNSKTVDELDVSYFHIICDNTALSLFSIWRSDVVIIREAIRSTIFIGWGWQNDYVFEGQKDWKRAGSFTAPCGKRRHPWFRYWIIFAEISRFRCSDGHRACLRSWGKELVMSTKMRL